MQTYSEQGFYVGDPCYALSDDDYDNCWGETGYSDGEIDIRGYKMLVHGTSYGDGCYGSTDGHVFPVDAGALAVIPLEVVKKEVGGLGQIYKTPGTAYMEYEDETREYDDTYEGAFAIELPSNTFKIYTGDEPREEDAFDYGIDY